MIDTDKQLDPESFPHRTEKGKIKGTIKNLQYLFEQYGIKCEYDEITKQQTVRIDAESDNDLSESSTYSQIKSLLALNNVPLNSIDLIPALLERARVNPVLDWVQSKQWDGKDRLTQLINTLTLERTTQDDEKYKALALTTWFIQCIAALDGARSTSNKQALPKFELVLVLQGGQGVKKTSWFKALVPRSMSQYITEGAHLDPADKDSVKNCISSWICELGELDATFRKADIARLKAFLSNEADCIRLPYDRVPSNFKRRTSFCASVNPKEFLTDSTGSRRFLPVAVIACDYDHNIDMQQFWAQVWTMYADGRQWWCTPGLDAMLSTRHSEHAEINSIAELLNDKYNMDLEARDGNCIHLSITKIMSECGIHPATNAQLKQAKDFLDRHGVKAVQVKGVRGYWLKPRNYLDDMLDGANNER